MWMFIATILKIIVGCSVPKYHWKVSVKSLKFTNIYSSMGYRAKHSQKQKFTDLNLGFSKTCDTQWLSLGAKKIPRVLHTYKATYGCISPWSWSCFPTYPWHHFFKVLLLADLGLNGLLWQFILVSLGNLSDLSKIPELEVALACFCCIANLSQKTCRVRS